MNTTSNFDYFTSANNEEFVKIAGSTTGRPIPLRKHVYGALVTDPIHPLYGVASVANSSISIDIWKGCPFQCVYCHVQDSMGDLVDGRMPISQERRTNFSIKEVVEVLTKHPFFIPNKSVISIGTASTEPFIPGQVADSTFEIMDEFASLGLQNPMWIVTKAGPPKGRGNDFARLAKTISKVMISICWADNPKHIEPARKNRFLNIQETHDAGVTVSWYMRPLVAEWGAHLQHIEEMMKWVSENYGKAIDMIIPGGLRWSWGIENGLVENHNVPLPSIPKVDHVKELTDDIWNAIFEFGNKYFPNIPIYRHSSCGLTKMLGVPSITGCQTLATKDCLGSRCPAHQRGICNARPMESLSLGQVQKILDQLGIPAKAISFSPNPGLITDPPMSSFTYAIRRTIQKTLATGGV